MPFESLTFAMLSDPGRVRRRNEDACAGDAHHGIFVVCDGVGGAAGGEIASRLAADSFLAHLIEMRQAGISPEVAMHNGVEYANRIVHRQSSQAAALRGMATTLVALYFEPGSTDAAIPSGAWLANVGDSRCYRLRDGQLEQLTLDHSVVEEQVRAGEMTREQADRSPIRNVITRAVGSESRVLADVQRIDVLPGDMYLLSSDGLMRELANPQIASILGAAVPRPADGTEDADQPTSNALLVRAVEELIVCANRNGGGDNITCLLVQAG
ncbi:PP2C family protein-serine/threonine phosphatase [Granulicella aggregans]|jgi:protein phosphatase|uniref:PP2C family protein-serine/threonine phosphatase n=1 Tax=Granulicella aggregans TaxID=474949 RepID=UPI0021DF4EFB|nr:protein phosphatase 2C domain-containing protein [Granulicella aggregans]